MIKTISLRKLACLFIIAILLIFIGCSPKQLDPKNSQLLASRKIAEEDLSKLKQTKTVFFYGQEKGAQLDSLKQAISQAWDFTPLVFAPYNSFDSYVGDERFSYFVIEGFTLGEERPASSFNPNGPREKRTLGSNFYLSLRMITKINKKGKVSTKQLCRIELSPNVKTYRYGDINRKADEIVDDLYDKGMFFNWSPVLLNAQIGAVSADLKHDRQTGLFEEFKKENLSQLLSSDTLYIPKRLLTTVNAFTAKEGEKPENVFAGYKYKYRICSDSELYEIFVTQKRGRFLFEFVRCAATKIFNIYDTREKEIVYRNHTNISYNIKEKDIERIQ